MVTNSLFFWFVLCSCGYLLMDILRWKWCTIVVTTIFILYTYILLYSFVQWIHVLLFFFFFFFLSTVITCMVNYFCSVLMRSYSSTNFVLVQYFDINLCISYFFKLMSALNGLTFWTLPWRKFRFPITLSLFDVFKIFDLLIFTCEVTVVYLLFFYLNKIFLSYFLLHDVYPISIYVYIVK